MYLKFREEFITKAISKLYLDDGSADVRFVFESDDKIIETIPAHKVILASASPVFYRMFFGTLKEGDSIKIVDASPVAFKEFIRLFYSSDMEFTSNRIFIEVVRLVDKYYVKDHLESYIEMLKKQLTDDNLVLIYDLAISLENEELKQICSEKIKKSKKLIFQNIEQQTLKTILTMDGLVCSEKDIFEGCVAWAKTSCTENGLDETNPKMLRGELGECFNLIRFGAMKDDLGTIMKNDLYASLFSADEILDLMRVSLCADFLSSKFNQLPRMSSFESSRLSPLVSPEKLTPIRKFSFISSESEGGSVSYSFSKRVPAKK